MNRPIKFRAAVTDNKGNFKRWAYGTPEFGDMGQLYIHEGIGSKTLCHRNSLGQFTGLTDKNGTEIYEGDIVRFDVDAGREGEPAYKNQLSAVSIATPLRVVIGDFISHYRDLEVIGNIYENPELLSSPEA